MQRFGKEGSVIDFKMTDDRTHIRHSRSTCEAADAIAAILKRVRRLGSDRRGAAAVEFAIVSGALITSIVFIMMVGVLLYIGQALDQATNIAGRQIMTGSVQKQALSQSSFQNTVLCPALPSLFKCSNVIISVQTFQEGQQPNGYYQFVNSNQTSLIMPTLSISANPFNPGTQGSYVYMQVVYPITFLPSFMAPLFATSTYNGSSAYLSTSTTTFRNEQF